jgi:hypothetical protein
MDEATRQSLEMAAKLERIRNRMPGVAREEGQERVSIEDLYSRAAPKRQVVPPSMTVGKRKLEIEKSLNLNPGLANTKAKHLRKFVNSLFDDRTDLEAWVEDSELVTVEVQ